MRHVWLVGLLLAGCTSEPQAPAAPVLPGAVAAITIAYRPVYKSQETSLGPMERLETAVLRSDAELTAYLQRVYGASDGRVREPFQLDFAQETGIMMAAGVQPDNGTQMRVTRLTEANGRLEVRFSAYGGGYAGATTANPILYVAIPRTELPTDVQKDAPCSLPPDQTFLLCR